MKKQRFSFRLDTEAPRGSILIINPDELSKRLEQTEKVDRGDYIVDFACLERRLIVEVDGAQHADEQLSHDSRRDHWLEGRGFRVRSSGVIGESRPTIQHFVLARLFAQNRFPLLRPAR